MIKNIFFIAVFLTSSLTIAQKQLRIGYIDMEYILNNVPEYTDAQAKLNDKVKVWQQKLDNLSIEIEKMETDLINEKALLTPAMILEREEDIDIKRKELKKLQEGYFGPTGDLYQMRKQFVKPVQDQVFNAIQTIAETKKYDFIFDKSSDLIMLYSNSNFDVSELVLNSIVKDRKRQTLEDNKNTKATKTKAVQAAAIPDPIEVEEVSNDTLTGARTEGEVKSPEQIKAEEKAAKQAELKARIKEQQEAREKLRDSLKRVSEERRAAKLKEIEEKNKKRDELLKETNN